MSATTCAADPLYMTLLFTRRTYLNFPEVLRPHKISQAPPVQASVCAPSVLSSDS
jgi:hypothetical protein